MLNWFPHEHPTLEDLEREVAILLAEVREDNDPRDAWRGGRWVMIHNLDQTIRILRRARPHG